MMRLSCVAFASVVVSVILAACAPLSTATQQTTPRSAQVIWSGRSDGFSIRWATNDISASAIPPSKQKPVIFSDLGFAVADFSSFGNANAGNCDFVRNVRVLSVVGPILSLEHADNMHCERWTQDQHRVSPLAINLRTIGKYPLLTDYFGPGDIYTQFMQSHLVTDALARMHQPHPAGLPGLVVALHRDRGICKSGIPKDILSHFAFRRVQAGSVSVRVGLPGDCIDNQITLWLPIPAALKRPLLAAAARKEGFLYDSEPSIAAGKTTTINYHIRSVSNSQ